MKQIKACLVCGKPVPKGLAYQGEIEYVSTDYLSGLKKVATLSGYICPVCNKNAGYRTNQVKLSRFKGEK